MRKLLYILFILALLSCSRHTAPVNSTIPFTFANARELMFRRPKTPQGPAKPKNNAVFFANEVGDIIVFKNYPHKGCDEFSLHHSQKEQIILGRWKLRNDSLILQNSRILTFHGGDSISCQTYNEAPQFRFFAVKNDSVISDLPDEEETTHMFERINSQSHK